MFGEFTAMGKSKILPKKRKRTKAARIDAAEADIDEVERAAAQLCDEMELREVIPSWDLLYQIILARIGETNVAEIGQVGRIF